MWELTFKTVAPIEKYIKLNDTQKENVLRISELSLKVQLYCSIISILNNFGSNIFRSNGSFSAVVHKIKHYPTFKLVTLESL